jgi:hypothetical protein
MEPELEQTYDRLRKAAARHINAIDELAEAEQQHRLAADAVACLEERCAPEPCDHPRSELLTYKRTEEGGFEMRKCLECTKIFRVRLRSAVSASREQEQT